MNIKDWIINWFDNHTDILKNEIENGVLENYFEKGWIDSLQFISFITELEKKFKIKFSNEEFQNRSFTTIAGITIIIEEKMNG